MIEVKDTLTALDNLKRFDREHPYIFSFVLSCFITAFIIFYSPQFDDTSENIVPYDNIQFIDIDTSEAQKRVVRKELSADTTDTSEPSDVERAVGVSDDPNAVDLSFYPNIAAPKPIGRFKKLYPKSAKDMNLEAQINVELLISPSGKVLSVNILGIRLSKALPPELHSVIAKDFARDARAILMAARFTPPVVDGKNVPIRMPLPLKFRLE
jgi:outer membrane biosynthesis protein TonB